MATDLPEGNGDTTPGYRLHHHSSISRWLGARAGSSHRPLTTASTRFTVHRTDPWTGGAREFGRIGVESWQPIWQPM